MSTTTAPKCDQLTADDLLGGDRTITITKVSGTGNPDQPVSVFFEGDGGKPYKPCKSMRRVMVHVWGRNAADYVGRSMVLYRDASVSFGGMVVGGIRIGAMSHMDRDQTMALTATKGRKALYKVEAMKAPKPVADKPVAKPSQPDAQAANDAAKAAADSLIARVRGAKTLEELQGITKHPGVIARQEKLRTGYPELAEKVAAAISDAIAFLDDGFPAEAPGAQGEG